MDFYNRALQLNEETIKNRRYLHENAEVGLNMPTAKGYVMKKLSEYGIEPKECGYGVTATIGKGGKVILLRADMDALPMGEESGEEFACKSGKSAHTCGHDLHTAMLLTCAKMLKEQEESLKGTVKLMFQPAEETFQGSKNMIENGILENVTASLAFHVAPGKIPIGYFMYNSGGVMMNSVDGFSIQVKGKGGHGAYPNNTIDPINIAVEIYIALESLIAREANPEKTCVLTIGKFMAGDAPNIIPDRAVIEGTLRTNDKEQRELLVRRINDVALSVANTFGGEVEVLPLSAVPPLICNKELTESMVKYMQEQEIPNLTPYPNMQANASEDYANIAEKVPSTFMYISAGFQDERGDYSAHNPKVRFNEQVCPIGASSLAHCAVRWLEDNI
jgi:amidohydrolase